MKPIVKILEDQIAQEEAGAKCDSDHRSELRKQARERDLHTKAREIVNWIGNGQSYKELTIHQEGVHLYIYFCNKQVFRVYCGSNIQRYQPGGWESILNEWHGQTRSRIVQKQSKRDGLRRRRQQIQKDFPGGEHCNW